MSKYRIAGNFDVFDAFQPDRQNLTCQLFKAMQHLVKDVTIRQNIFRQIFEKSASIKISRYTVDELRILLSLVTASTVSMEKFTCHPKHYLAALHHYK